RSRWRSPRRQQMPGGRRPAFLEVVHVLNARLDQVAVGLTCQRDLSSVPALAKCLTVCLLTCGAVLVARHDVEHPEAAHVREHRLPVRPRPPMRRKIDGMARARRHTRFFPLQRAVLACTGHSGSSSDLCSDDRHPSIAYCATCPTQRKETFPFPLQPAFTAPNSPSYP